MCGIVGYNGIKNAVEVVLDGLKRLEYRGYDSSGICFKNELGKLSLYKKSGKLENLKNILSGKKCTSHACIGHTRWATHGEVNDANAHPHLSDSIAIGKNDSIAIVHNGIIENATDLKNALVNKGHKFSSDTDSEVFLALVVDELNGGEKFQQAVASAFKMIKGNSAFVIQFSNSDKILAIKRGAPLVCGTNSKTKEALVSSDPYALAGFVDHIYFPEDNVLCELQGGPACNKLLNFTELDGEQSIRFISKAMDLNLDVAAKGTYEHYMLKEIFEQPGLIRSLLQYYFKGEGAKTLANIKKEIEPPLIHIVACGTAWHAGLLIKNFLEKYNRIPCTIDLASEFRYRDPLIKEKEVGLFISQSGETADTLAAQELCKKQGIRTFSIVNVEGSTLFRNCDENCLIKAGVEIGVASTKAFTLQVLTGRLASLTLMKEEISGPQIYSKYSLLAERIDHLLNQAEYIQRIAEEIHNYKGFMYTGRGHYYPVALEGALKLKEIAYVHAEGYAAGELKHGPIALIDEQMVNVAIVGPELYDKTVSNIQEIRARRGIIVTIGPEDDRRLEGISNFYIPLNFSGLEELSPLYANVATQLLAYYMAKFKGTDIDTPRNLAKSVTVE